mgnify:FL=1
MTFAELIQAIDVWRFGMIAEWCRRQLYRVL